MVDVVDRRTRSRMMAGIRGKDTKPELQVRQFLRGHGFRFSLAKEGVPGRPDLVFPAARVAVFVHGCFWHRHRGCRLAYVPKSNTHFWKRKFAENVRRDRLVEGRLRRGGWSVLTVWQCSIHPQGLVTLLDRVTKRLAAQHSRVAA